MRNQCPVCRRMNCIHEIAFMNTENFGGGGHKIACSFCSAPLEVGMHREVHIDSIMVGKFDRDDWGNPCVTPSVKIKPISRKNKGIKV